MRGRQASAEPDRRLAGEFAVVEEFVPGQQGTPMKCIAVPQHPHLTVFFQLHMATAHDAQMHRHTATCQQRIASVKWKMP